jgi:signal transduction histidine kinase
MKRYASVKTSIINNGSHLIAVFSDITRLKEIEKEGQVLRSQFFSSVAHELRTPLNSVIPILKLVISTLQRHISDPRELQASISVYTKVEKLC